MFYIFWKIVTKEIFPVNFNYVNLKKMHIGKVSFKNLLFLEGKPFSIGKQTKKSENVAHCLLDLPSIYLYFSNKV